MEAKTPGAGGPVSVMLAEHETGRVFVRAIDENLPRAAAEVPVDEAARTAVADNLALYAELLRMHIHKENEVLFPLAERTLDDETKHALAAEFERVEAEETGAGVHRALSRDRARAGQAPSLTPVVAAAHRARDSRGRTTTEGARDERRGAVRAFARTAPRDFRSPSAWRQATATADSTLKRLTADSPSSNWTITAGSSPTT